MARTKKQKEEHLEKQFWKAADKLAMNIDEWVRAEATADMKNNGSQK